MKNSFHTLALFLCFIICVSTALSISLDLDRKRIKYQRLKKKVNKLKKKLNVEKQKNRELNNELQKCKFGNKAEKILPPSGFDPLTAPPTLGSFKYTQNKSF
jgi:hypothetical protein